MQISAFTKLIILVTLAFCSYNFTVLAETVEFNTVTEALNYNGDKATVTKLIITGTIAGNDYSKDSEWSKFCNLDNTFSNIEEVEIFTDQDIPDYDEKNQSCLFNSVKWLKKFSAPNVKYIGNYAFVGCFYLISVDFPLATTIGNGAFHFCSDLTSIDFPLVTTIKYTAFTYCKNLVSATFGTGFETETEIEFGMEVFGDGKWGSGSPILTQNIELTLGKNVLPVPDLNANTWQTIYGNETGTPYTWKSIKITDGIEEIIKNATVSIFPNPTVGNATVSFELEKSCNVKIILSNTLGQELIQVFDGFADVGTFNKTIDTGHLSKGVYFVKILINGNSTVKKIILE